MSLQSEETGGAGSPRKAVAFGLLVWFVVIVDAARFLRADLLTSPEISWAIPRLVLTVLVIAASSSAGILAAAGFFLWSRTTGSREPLEPLRLRATALALIAMGAMSFGVLIRFAWLADIPPTVWFDEVLPIGPSLALTGGWQDFRDSIRILPVGGKPVAAVGVLYLEGYRLILRLLGPGVFAMRFPGALEGAFSLVTAFLLARLLLPRGGATVAVLVLAGLRWQIILARFGWNGLALVPIVDIATLLLITARRRLSLAAAAAGGLVAGIGAHVYLAAWIAAAPLGAFLIWPQTRSVALRRRVALALLFGVGFLAAASPLFLFRQGRPYSYFVRASHQSLLLDYRRTHDWTLPFTIVADAFQAPWIVPDPERRQDLPKSRLGWIVGIPIAVAFLRAFCLPREDLSALILAHAAVALGATLRWGFPGHPNGFRFLYLTTVTAVVAASGVLWLVGRVGERRRRLTAIAALGVLSVGAALGARDALFRWGESRQTFDSYWSESTLVGRAELRWRRYGLVERDPALSSLPIVVRAVVDNRLDPNDRRVEQLFLGTSLSNQQRCFRIAGPKARPAFGERLVEVLRDAWGRDHGVVFARRYCLN